MESIQPAENAGHTITLTDDELLAVNVLLDLEPQVKWQGSSTDAQRRFDYGRISARWKIRDYCGKVETNGDDS